jgi:hypothetical protein
MRQTTAVKASDADLVIFIPVFALQPVYPLPAIFGADRRADTVWELALPALKLALGQRDVLPLVASVTSH